MSTSTNFHNVATIRVSDLYSHIPGKSINLDLLDDKGNQVIAFLNDKTLKLLADAISSYAETRDAAPVDPKPTYAEALFAKPTEPAGSFIPF